MDHRRATIFGRYADDYARWRPTYPAEAVDWLLPEGASRVADVGAGTGQLTGLLLDRGLHIDAVEPDADMLGALRRLHPTATAHLAGAEELPLADGSVDAVLVGTAWHWFSHEAAVREVRRVLRPGRWLGLVYNVVAPVEAWEVELAGLDPDLGDEADGDKAGQAPSVPGLAHEATETAIFPWTWQVTPEHWRSCLATHSAFAVMDDAEREERLDASQKVVATYCDEAGRTHAPLRYEAFCLRWRPVLETARAGR